MLLLGTIALPSSHKLLPVPAERVTQVWPMAAPLLQSAIVKMKDDYTIDMLREDAESGERQLWLVDDGFSVKAAALTMIVQDKAGLTGWLTHCGGSEQKLWSRMVIDGISGYFACEGCHRFVIVARKGWTKFLPDFDASAVLLEKAL